MHIILTACTQRKRFVPRQLLNARSLSAGPLGDVAGEWKDRLSQVEPVATATDLYCGRSFVEARKAAKSSNGELYVVSAGLGLLRNDDIVPAYNLTVSKGSPDCVLEKIEDHKKAPDWWIAIAAAQAPLEVLERTKGLIIIALPSPYLRMIYPALAGVSESTSERIRIVGAQDVPEANARLLRQILPYDDRLDGPQSPLRGTRSDFPSRAARHFVEAILESSPLGDVDDHAELVKTTLAQWERPYMKTGIRVSDVEIKSIIRENWDRTGGKSTKLLRSLRDELNIACEQKRFARLATEVRLEREV